tara:strand:+ start:841 stop:1038 length:198 start_codon:yes stop_codon:yes gene_type:complete
MIKVGSMVQSEYTHNGKKGNIGIVLKIADPYTANHQSAPVYVARVFYPKTRTSGWVDLNDMKVVA